MGQHLDRWRSKVFFLRKYLRQNSQMSRRCCEAKGSGYGE